MPGRGNDSRPNPSGAAVLDHAQERRPAPRGEQLEEAPRRAVARGVGHHALVLREAPRRRTSGSSARWSRAGRRTTPARPAPASPAATWRWYQSALKARTLQRPDHPVREARRAPRAGAAAAADAAAPPRLPPTGPASGCRAPGPCRARGSRSSPACRATARPAALSPAMNWSMSSMRSLSMTIHGDGTRIERELDLEDVAGQAHAADGGAEQVGLDLAASTPGCGRPPPACAARARGCRSSRRDGGSCRGRRPPPSRPG